MLWSRKFGWKIFRKEIGSAMIRAIMLAFCKGVRFRIAFSEIARARVMTRKNQVLIIVFQRYLIRIEIRAKARANDKRIDRNVGEVVSCGVSSPKGSGRFVYWLTMKRPMNCVARNMVSRVSVIENLCFILSLILLAFFNI